MESLWKWHRAIIYCLALNLYLAPLAFANEVLKGSVSGAWRNAGYLNPSISTLDSYLYEFSDEEEYTHGLELDIIVLRGSGWEKDTIKKRIKHLSDIYKQCRVKFNNVKLVEVDPPSDGRLDFFPWYRKNTENEEEQNSSTYRLARSYPDSGIKFSITYIRSFTNGETGTSGPIWYYGVKNPMLYKQFISLVTDSDDYIRKRPTGYSVEAHELGHALFESTHVGRNNIMALTTSKRIPKIRVDHCKTALDHELVRKLKRTKEAMMNMHRH